MDKQIGEVNEMVEEMAKYCCNACEMGWGCDFGDCTEKGKDGYKNCKLAKETAEMIYNAGYRKLDDHAIMVLRKAKDMEERIRKETAEKFAARVKMAFYYEFDELIPSIMADKIDEICKEITEGKDEKTN